MYTPNLKSYFTLLFELLAVVSILFFPSLKAAGKASKPGSKPVYIECDEAIQKRTRDDIACGKIDVYEDRKSGAGRSIPLHFIVVRSVQGDKTRHQAPIFAIAGGPGFPASDYLDVFLQRLTPNIRQYRDLVLVDVRGTGQSNGLACGADPGRLNAEDYLHYVPSVEQMRHCLTELQNRARLSKYTSSNIVEDINELRSALGYKEIAIFARSYGTRLALEFIRRYESFVELALLRGILPAQIHTPSGYPRHMEYVMKRLYEDCYADPICSGKSGDMRSTLLEIVNKLKDQAVQVRVSHPANEDMQEVNLDHLSFIYFLRSLLFGAEQSSRLPYYINSAARGKFEKIAQAIINAQWKRSQRIYLGQYFSIVCTEDLPFIDMEREQQEAQGTLLGMHRVTQEKAICDIWPDGEISSDFHEPLTTKVPVLMLAGELDPATPPSLAFLAAANLTHSKVVVFKNRSHYLYDIEARRCEQSFVPEFFRSASLDGLNTSCADSLGRLPFYSAELGH